MTELKVAERRAVAGNAVTWRAVLLGLAGTAVLAWLVPVFDLQVQGTWIASCHLPIGVFNLLVLLLLVNAALKVLRPRFALSRRELLVVYCLMLVGSGLPSFGFTEYLFPTLAGTLYYARPENRWAERTFRYIPQWFVPWDVAEAARALGGALPPQRMVGTTLRLCFPLPCDLAGGKSCDGFTRARPLTRRCPSAIG
jgi:hypothetical protein